MSTPTRKAVKRQLFSWKLAIGSLLLVLLLTGGWWTYKLIWGKPLNINHFYERVLVELLWDDPQLLTSLGIIDNTLLDFHSDELTDTSPAREERLAMKVKRDLGILRSYAPEDLNESQQLSSAILDWFLDDVARTNAFMYYNYPVNQLDGVQISLPEFMINQHRVINERSARNYVKRLSLFGVKFNQVLEGLRLREKKGLIPPRPIVERVLVQMRDFIGVAPEENALYTTFVEKLNRVENLSAAQRDELTGEVRRQIQESVYPAYQRLITYFETLLPQSTADLGVWRFPNGDAYYAQLLRSRTTTDYTPEQMHQTGLREVARIEAEMRSVLDGLGYIGGTVAEHMRALTTDPRFLYSNNDTGRTQALHDLQAIIDEIDGKIGSAFDLLPRQKVEVHRVPVFKEQTAPSYYQAPALDGSRPGVFFVNLRDMNTTPKWILRALAYHEAIPGHHFQIALQQQMQDVPTFRKVIPFLAFIEGWAVYAERLAWEQGFHRDAYSNLGYLSSELLNSVMLVVDTGIHYKRWSREQAIDYFRAHSSLSDFDTEKYVDRLSVRPGQACTYSMGALKILELREKAQKQLGNRFKLSDFHNIVLKKGAMPMSVLEDQIDAYIRIAGKDD